MTKGPIVTDKSEPRPLGAFGHSQVFRTKPPAFQAGASVLTRRRYVVTELSNPLSCKDSFWATSSRSASQSRARPYALSQQDLTAAAWP
jgi:hypothetical protein